MEVNENIAHELMPGLKHEKKVLKKEHLAHEMSLLVPRGYIFVQGASEVEKLRGVLSSSTSLHGHIIA